jgi:predicted metal-dependent HD superfamily phosphohydrolase
MFNRWEKLCQHLHVPGVIKHQTFKMLSAAYDSPSVFYHNFDHIKWCLEELDGLALLPYSLEHLLIETSLWFHDAVYHAQSATNEEDSAFLASQFLATGSVGAEFAQKVRNIIIATKHHYQPDLTDLATCYALDIDLASLGFPLEQFNKNSEDIYKEYAPFVESKDVYDGARAKFFSKMLERPNIYYTEHFRVKYEASARSNILSVCSNQT